MNLSVVLPSNKEVSEAVWLVSSPLEKTQNIYKEMSPGAASIEGVWGLMASMQRYRIATAHSNWKPHRKFSWR